MHFRKQDAVLAAYITVVGALLSATPARAAVDEQCFDTWVGCLEAISKAKCAGTPGCPAGDGTTCPTTKYEAVCWGDM